MIGAHLHDAMSQSLVKQGCACKQMQRKLIIALLLAVCFMIVEIVGGVIANRYAPRNAVAISLLPLLVDPASQHESCMHPAQEFLVMQHHAAWLWSDDALMLLVTLRLLYWRAAWRS